MVYYIDRESNHRMLEPVWGRSSIELLYKKHFGFGWLQNWLARVVASPFFSNLWGSFHDLPRSKKRILPFCKKFNIDLSICKKPPEAFESFNDFFTRSLSKASRPICTEADTAIIPADARYTFYENLTDKSSFIVKGTHFQLADFLNSKEQAARFYGGTLILGRLCPLDCHRFYFPYKGEAKKSQLIDGPLFSVSPIATKGNPWIFWTNKRVKTEVLLHKGSYCMVEIGATNCGTIVQTFAPGNVATGQEKGFFKLGGSAIALLFEKDKFELVKDLSLLSGPLEVYCKIGQKLGRIIQ